MIDNPHQSDKKKSDGGYCRLEKMENDYLTGAVKAFVLACVSRE